MDGAGAEEILTILRDHLAPEAADSAYRGVVRFLQFKRAGLTIDVHTVGFDLLRRNAESKMQMGGAAPVASVSVQRMQRAAFSLPGKSLALASAQGDWGLQAIRVN